MKMMIEYWVAYIESLRSTALLSKFSHLAKMNILNLDTFNLHQLFSTMVYSDTRIQIPDSTTQAINPWLLRIDYIGYAMTIGYISFSKLVSHPFYGTKLVPTLIYRTFVRSSLTMAA
ncbi:hypothetical protein TNCV_1820611 [Trichonephila clavipes]|nr:hypothetical protein TNCV_1820611 [Trichonephila clavipes]